MKIDFWTLGFQAVNVLVLIWLLQRFFWRPVAAIIAQRQATARQTLADAQAQTAKAADALAEIARTRAGFAGERDAILAASHAEAERARDAILQQANEAATRLATAAKTAIDAERQAAEKAWADRSSQLGVDIARRLAARLDGSAVQAAFLAWLIEAIGKLPDSVRQAIAAQNAALEAVSGTPLDDAAQAHATRSIGEAFGAHPKVAYSTDPTMIAGMELHAPHLVVGNSWRADLAAILADLSHAE